MKTKQYILKGIIILSVLMGTSACNKDFLDETNYGSQSAEEFYATKSGYENLIVGCYSNLRTIYNSKDYQNVTQLGTDAITQGFGGNVNALNQYTVNFDANQGSISNYWNMLYEALKDVNAAIDRAPAVIMKAQNPEGMDPAVLEQRVAEARALRAMFLFEIVRNWGKAPLMVHEPLGAIKTAELSPATAFYDQILSDLGAAIPVLPPKQTGVDYGRMSASAAKHLRALVYLTRGYESYAEANDFTNAFNDAVDVIQNSGHVMLSDYLQVHRYSNETNNEIIFSVGYSNSANNNTNNWHKWYLFPYFENRPGLGRSAVYGNDDVFGIPTKFTYTLFNWQKDRRAEVTFMSPVNGNPATSVDGKNTGKNWFHAINAVPGQFAVGDTVIYFPVPTDPNYKQWTPAEKAAKKYAIYNYPTGDPTDMSSEDYYKDAFQGGSAASRTWLPVWKFKDPNAIYNAGGAGTGTRNIYIYRLAETYLIAAEAAVKRGINPDALTYLNFVRDRAEKGNAELEISGTVTLDHILDERALELFGEVPRWNDLQRTRKLTERVLLYNWDARNITGGVQTQLTQNATKYYLRPLPTSWLNSLSNGSELSNNPGW